MSVVACIQMASGPNIGANLLEEDGDADRVVRYLEEPTVTATTGEDEEE